MKSLKLCSIAFVAGVGIAAATQYPVLETLGYLPEETEVANKDSDPKAPISLATETVVDAELPVSDPAEVMKTEVVSNNSEAASALTPVSESKPTPSKADKADAVVEFGNAAAKEHVEAKRSISDSKMKVVSEPIPKPVGTNDPATTNLKPAKKEIEDVAKSESKPSAKVVRPKEVLASRQPSKAKPSERIAKAKAPRVRKFETVTNPNITQSTNSDKSVPLASNPVARSTPKAKTPKRVVVAKPAIRDITNQPKSEVKTKPATKTPQQQTQTVFKPESQDLNGKWFVTRAVHAGRTISFDKLKTMTMEIEGDQIVIVQGGKREVAGFEPGKVRQIGETSFAELKITSNRGAKEIRGFYYFDTDELTMIWGAPGAERPDPTKPDEMEKARILTLQLDQ